MTYDVKCETWANAGGARNPHPGPLPGGEGENNVFFIGLVSR